MNNPHDAKLIAIADMLIAANKSIGPLSLDQMIDLILDNFSCVEGSVEAEDLLVECSSLILNKGR